MCLKQYMLKQYVALFVARVCYRVFITAQKIQCDFQCSEFWLFMITVWNGIVVTVDDWSQQSGMRPYVGKCPPFCCCADHSQLSKAVFFIKWRWLVSCFMEWYCHSVISVLYASIKCLIDNKCPCLFLWLGYFCYWYFVSCLLPSTCFISITRKEDFPTYQP